MSDEKIDLKLGKGGVRIALLMIVLEVLEYLDRPSKDKNKNKNKEIRVFGEVRSFQAKGG